MSKRDVLKAFKALQRITQKTFEGDKRAIAEARQRINLEFKKDVEGKGIGKTNWIIINKHLITDSSFSASDEKLKVAEDVGKMLKHQVVQAVKNPETDNYGR